MPQCPHCQTPYEEGQRYCKMCGSFLLHPEQGNTFCPQCGVRVSPRQEFCHECDAPLREAAAAEEPLEPEPTPPAPPATAPKPSPVPAILAGTPSWLIGLLAGTGAIIIILLILLFTRGTSTPPVPRAEAPGPTAPGAPATPGPAATSTAAPLKEQLQKVLSTLREAQLQQNIYKFMSVYSFTYPNLDDKRDDTLQSWKNYDFTNLVFTVDKIEPVDADNVIAWVTWYIDTKDRRTQEPSTSTQTYKVQFAKELGKWRIRSLEEAEE